MLLEGRSALALVRERARIRYGGKYLPSVLSRAQEKLQVTFSWPRIVLLSTWPHCFSESRAGSQSLLSPAAMAEWQSQCIDLFCISIHMTDADRHDLCPGAGGMNKNLLERSKERDAEGKWMRGAFLLSTLFPASKHLGTWLLFYYCRPFFVIFLVCNLFSHICLYFYFLDLI